MYFVQPPFLLRKLYRSCTWRVDEKQDAIYLTFDDGPIPEITPWVLDTLKKYNAKATFFCIGKNVEAHPDIYRSILSAGHSAGNHTYQHLNGWQTETTDYLQDIRRCRDVMKTFSGGQVQEKMLFRPPYGRLSMSQIAHLKSQYKIVMWDVLSGDFDTALTKEKCLSNVLHNTRPGSIVVFHDSLKAAEKMRFVLPSVLEYFSGKNYSFESL